MNTKNELSDVWEFKDLPEDRFNSWQWAMHYLWVSRVVYDPVWEEWKIRPNGYNPLIWIMLILAAPVAPFFTSQTIQETFHSVRKLFTDGDGLWELWRTDGQGNYKYMSYSEVYKHA